jgi:hypothetical protein
MDLSESQKYISGRKLENKMGQRWEGKLNFKRGSLGLDIVSFRLIDSGDLIAREAETDRPIIIDGSDDSKDHILEIEMYRFDRKEVERLENEDPELILEYMIDSELINGAYISQKPDPEKIINRLNRRLENITAISNRAGLSPREKTCLEKKQNDLKDDIERERNRQKKQHPVKKRLRPNQIAKKKCRKAAKKLQKEFPEMRSGEMACRPELLEIASNWTKETRQRWIADLFPESLRKPGRPKSQKR